MIRKKFFYGWVISLAGFLILGVTLGFYNNCMSAFVEPVTRELSLTRSSFMLTITIRALAIILAIPIFNKLYKKYSIKRIMLVCAVICSGSVYLNSYCTGIWQFYVLSIIYGIFVTGISTLTISILIGNWFHWKRGTAIGLAFAGSGIVASAITPVVNNIINNVSWQAGYQFLGVLGLVILLIAIIFMVNDSPEKKGTKPLELEENSDIDSKLTENRTASLIEKHPNQKETKVKSLVFLCGFIAVFIIGLMATGIQQHIMASLTDSGYTVAKVSTMISIFLGALTFTKILWGYIYDKVSPYASFVLIALSMLLSGMAFGLAQHYEIFIWLFAISFSFAFANASVAVSHIVSCFFDDAYYVDFCGYLTIAGTLGGSIGPLFSGFVYDITGTYTIAIWAYIILSGFLMGVLSIGWEALKIKKP